MAHSIMVPGPGNYNPHVRYYKINKANFTKNQSKQYKT